jgi:chemotaxis protein methyltransferase CheR
MNPPPQVFAILCQLIEERTGLRYSADDARLINDKLRTRAEEAGFESLLDYYYYLRYEPNSVLEFNNLVDALVVNETYFFREVDALQCVVRDVLLPLLEQGQRPRVWSAACATGEEPFTLALLLASHGVLDRVEIVATDISERALELAKSGLFRPRSLRGGPPPRSAERWLQLCDGRPVLDWAIRSAVSFSKLNLVEAGAMKQLGTFDVILCRNVLIYFADETIAKLVRGFTELLKPNGVLLIGTCESLLRFSTDLLCEERNGTFLYRRSA